MRIVGFGANNSASTEYRVAMWVRALGRLGHDAEFVGELDSAMSRIDALLNGADVVISGHTHDARKVAVLLAGRKAYRYKLVIDTDDLVTAIPGYNHASRSFHPATGIVRIIEAQYREADALTVATKPLAAFVSKYNGNVLYTPNCIDPEIHSSIVRHEREPHYTADQRIHWGGGGGHWDDLLLVRDPLLRIFNERPKVKLIFSNFVPAWAADLPARRVFMLPLVPFATYPRLVARVSADVALAPLVDNEFNRAKSHCKWLDYTIGGAAGVYQRLTPYDSVTDGRTGLKAATPGEWYDAITTLLDRPAMRDAIVANARNAIHSLYHVDTRVRRYEAWLTELVERKPIAIPAQLEEGVPIACQAM